MGPDDEEGGTSEAAAFEGRALTVRVPMRLGRCRRRKRILAPDGSELTPPSKPQPDTTLVKALARAWRWQRLLDQGVYALVTEIGEAEKISKSYVSRILRLALLAPSIVEAVLTGSTALNLDELERPGPLLWEDQRASIGRSRAECDPVPFESSSSHEMVVQCRATWPEVDTDARVGRAGDEKDEELGISRKVCRRGGCRGGPQRL